MAAALLLLLGSGCAASGLRPATPEGVGPVVREAPGLRLSVAAEAWQGRPRNLPEAVLPFLVRAANTGSAPLPLAREDFLLLDQGNRQYLPLAPAEVVTLLGGRGPGVAVSPSVGVEASSGGGWAGGIGLGIAFGRPGVDPREILGAALAEGAIQPGAEFTGFLFFPLPAPGATRLRLLYVPRGGGEPQRLEFPFRPAGG